MARVAHLPPAQQQALLAQVVAQQQQVARQMAVMQQQQAARQQQQAHARQQRPAMDELQAPGSRVGRRMTGLELQLILRHQAYQLQMNDPVDDDFYHHFWIMKGGHSKAKHALSAPSTTTTSRRLTQHATNEQVGASLGAGNVSTRPIAAKIAAPKPLIEMGGPPDPPDGAFPSDETGAPPDGAGPPALLSASRWHTRSQVAAAREALIGLRVHASSAAVRTPAGQEQRRVLLERLFSRLRSPGGAEGAPPPEGGAVSPELLCCEKGQKLVADVMPLLPPPLLAAVLQAVVAHLGAIARSKSPRVTSFCSGLAAAPKLLPVEQAAALLAALPQHGEASLALALGRPELSALLLGLLCHPHVAVEARPAVEAAYQALLPLLHQHEQAWALLDAIVPGADGAHADVLRALLGRVDSAAVSAACAPRLEAVRAMLAQ